VVELNHSPVFSDFESPALYETGAIVVKPNYVRTAIVAASIGAALTLLAAPMSASAAIPDGGIDLGTATPYGVLAGSTVTNTGPTTITGDVGLSPGSAITGFPPGIVNGVFHAADAEAIQAKTDLTTAYNQAAGLVPTTTGLGNLGGLSLVPGVYAGNLLSITGTLTLEGTAASIWVFQAANTLTTASSSNIIINGGATACNVFWQVGSSATFGTGSNFAGTVMAQTSITANTGATFAGRLLALTGATTLDTNVLTRPAGCDVTSPTVTSSAPTGATVGTPYSFTVVATGTPTPSYTVTSGALPAGLTLDAVTGVISGTPTTAGTATFTITAANGVSPAVDTVYSIVTAAAAAAPAATLPNTGPNAAPLVATGAVLMALGVALVTRRRARRH